MTSHRPRLGRRKAMRRSRPALVLALGASLGLVAVPLEATGASDGEDPQVRVIVELAAEPALAGLNDSEMTVSAADTETLALVEDRRAALRSAHDVVLDAAGSAGLEVETRHEYTDLISAAALTVRESDIDALQELPGITGVIRDQRATAAVDTSVPLIGAPEVWELTDSADVPVRGEGTTVAVLDTGVDYTNPSLGGGFGPEHKVVGGYDYVNDDADPMDDNGHGTHVAGIIGGDAEVTGVAPAANITAYKVLDSGGSGWESDIIAALEAAVDPGNPHRADVVNLSLGGPGDGTDPLGRAAHAATEAGVVVVASAGNSGPGAQTVGSPAVVDSVIAVGASASGIRLPQAHLVAPRDEPIQTFRAPYSASPPTEPQTGQLVDVGAGTEADYDEAGDVTGKVVAYRASIPRELPWVNTGMIEAARRAEDRGAIALLAYNESTGPGPVAVPQAGETAPGAAHEPDQPDGTVDVPLPARDSGDSFRMDHIVVMGLLETQWSRLSQDLADGAVEITISGEDVTDQVASFSSRGPTTDFRAKPDLVAPGVEIRSAWPTQQWEPGVYRLSGTSMAAPHAAGAAALLRQLEPGTPAERIGAKLIGSAAGLDDAAVTTAGAGRLDVAAAAVSPLSAAPAAFSLGLADLSGDTVAGSDSVTLYNDGDEDVRVRLRAEPHDESPGTVALDREEAQIPAGGELKVELSVSADLPDGDTDISGWVVAEVEGAPQVRVPYLLAVRPLVVRSSPDPSDGTSAAFIWSPTALAEPPVITVTPSRGKAHEVTATHDHDNWYRAELDGLLSGVHQLSARAPAQTGQVLAGATSLEVADGRGGTPSPVHWQPVGPNGSAGPIATTPADTDVAAVTQYLKAGPWRTDDGGQTWTQQNRLPVAAGTGTAIIDAQDPDTMWYAINSSTRGIANRLDPTYQGRILRTHDGGENWQSLDFPDVHVIDLLSDPGTTGLVAVTADSLMISTDDGDSWSGHPNPVGDEITSAAVAGSDVYVATSSGVWAVRGLLTGQPEDVERVYEASGGYSGRVVDMVADDTLVAMLIGGNRVMGSLDSGASWQELYHFADGGGMSIVMRDGDIAVSTYRQHNHMGRDHGASWTTVPQPVNGAIEDDFAHGVDGGLWWSSPGAGLFHTDDDGNDPQRIGVQGVTVYDMGVTADESGTPQLLAGTDHDVYDTQLPTRTRLDPNVAEWGLSGSEAHVGARIGQLAVSEQDVRTVWKVRKDSLSQFWVYRSTDGGQNWEQRGRTQERPFDIAVGPTDSNRVVVPYWSLAGAGLYVTTDGGDTWDKFFHDETFTTVAADPADPGRLWLGSASGLYRSDDFGQTVRKVTGGQVTAVEVSGQRIVAGGQEIQVSDDGGQTFRTADSGDVDMVVSDIVVSPDGRTWYAATSSFTANGLPKGGRGVLRSRDDGQTWVNVSLRLENLDVLSLEMSPDGRWLFAGTVEGGVHRVHAR